MSTLSHLDDRQIKANGVHYTPPDLAMFLAEVTIRHASFTDKPIVALDPACGDGGLLSALAQTVPAKVRRRMRLVGYETDPVAASRAEENLREIGVAGVDIRRGDFLDDIIANHASGGASPLFASPTATTDRYDIVISNPPYVRTQVLGADRSRQLAATFDLNGRVDLYHAFIKAISLALRPGGTLGLLTSNRFMLIQSGASARELLAEDFALRDLYDLGDTKLFNAAVLPAIVVARRVTIPEKRTCPFTRVYEVRNGAARSHTDRMWPSVLDAVRSAQEGNIATATGNFRIERGELTRGDDRRSPWSLSSASTKKWLAVVNDRRVCSFGDVAHVRVGIKTNADEVFARDDWDTLPKESRPETALLRPLITHHVADRWTAKDETMLRKRVLYPHEEAPDGSRRTIDLSEYPRAQAYLRQYRRRLETRQYLIDAGRAWYELWVPQQPRDWSQPKIVYPDISEYPKFFLDTTGAVVNGDCYWMTLNHGLPAQWLYLILAVANSSFITSYYDTVFHNKLYAGRRRFMTQYVREFPLPSIDGAESRRIIEILMAAFSRNTKIGSDIEEELDRLVWRSFGLRKEPVG